LITLVRQELQAREILTQDKNRKMAQAAERLDGREHFWRADLDRQQEFVIQPQGRITFTEVFGGLPGAQQADTSVTLGNQAPNFLFDPWFLDGKKTQYQAG
jgi:hypothetical protein